MRDRLVLGDVQLAGYKINRVLSGPSVYIGAKTPCQEIKQLKDEPYRENLALKEEIDHASMFEEIVGTSEVLRRVLVLQGSSG